MIPRRSAGPVPLSWALPGRQVERDQFAEVLADAIQGSPRFLLFEGEQGSGKSRLLEEIAISPLLPRRRIRVATFALDADDTDVVARAARALARNPVYERIGGRRRILSTLRRLLPEWMGAIPGWGDLLEAIYRTADVIRRRRNRGKPTEQIEEDVEQILEAARRRPVALLVDNLELANDAAMERLRKLLRLADVGTRLLVVGAFRTAPPGAPRPPIRLLADRLPAQRVLHRRLGPLSADDIRAWLEHRLPGASATDSFRAWLLAETGGQPGALEASVAGLLERGAIQQLEHGWTIDQDTALEAAEAAGPDLDLTRLGTEAAATVRAASVFGDHFAGDELAKLLSCDELVVEDHLAIAARFGLVEVLGTMDRSNGDIATSYRFSSSSARAALQRALPPEQRRALESRRAQASAS